MWSPLVMSTVMFGHVRGRFLDTPAVMPWSPLLRVELVGEPVGRVSVPVGRALDDYPRLG